MRMKDEEIKSIREAILKRDPCARIYLFGSRADDSQRGGDIDLLVLSQKLTLAERRKIKLDLYRRLGAQKIDILLAQDQKKAFVRQALEEGIAL